ncbi:metal ABC transporter substrate-binding protein [Leucobacter sp. W1153]|uniref:metal ABC transporter substrate-binding protein n=1 Tax=Leucobacter sp. W1153 TaxID=3439064 RepID=UPI003F32966E
MNTADSRTIRPTRLGALTAVSLAAAAALALAGCTSGSGDSGAEGEAGTLRVVTTTTQLTDFAGQVGGDDITLTGLLTAGASAHHFDPSPADLLELGRADVLIVNGAGLETFIDSAVESSGFDGTIIVAGDGIDLHEAEEITAEGFGGDHDHAAEAVDDHDHDGDGESDHAAEDHTTESHASEATESAEESHDGHDHGDINPHLWTSPQYAADMVNEIAEGLGAADPERAELFTENAAAYTERLYALDEWIAAQFDRVPEADRVLVSGHDSLRYYLHDYDIAFAGSILPSFEDNAEPSAAQIDELVASITENGVKAVFVESSMSPKLAQTIAQEAGVTVVDAESLYADSLGASGSGAETYIDATIHNTRLILEAWGAAPDELPSVLQ